MIQFGWRMHARKIQVGHAITLPTCLFDVSTILTATTGPLPLQHTTTILYLAGSIVKVKSRSIKPVMIGPMTAGRGFLGQEYGAPVPLELAGCGRVDGKTAIDKFGVFTELSRAISKYLDTFLFDMIR